MPFLKRDLEDMRVGWQKVADNGPRTIYVFKRGSDYHAVTNPAQGVGELFETIRPRTEESKEVAPHGQFEIARAEAGYPQSNN